MTLTTEQRRMLAIADQMGEPPQGITIICPGFHFCPDFDFLPICADSPEWEACTCQREARDD